MQTTLNKIREHQPREDEWEKLLRYLNKTQADDEPLNLKVVLENNGVKFAIWCLRAVDGFEKEKSLFAVACARRVQHLMEDGRSKHALDVAERYVLEQATIEEMLDAYSGAHFVYCSAAFTNDPIDAVYGSALYAAKAALNIGGDYNADDVYAAAIYAANAVYVANANAAYIDELKWQALELSKLLEITHEPKRI
jgi:hypothetical protein